MYNKKISWNENWILIFICFMSILLLDSLASSSSSFMIASFLIQMLRWISNSSRVEIFIFLIDWGIFFGRWELDLQRRASSFSQSLLKVSLPSGTHSLNEWIPWSWEAIQGGHHHFCILHFFFSWFLKVIFRYMFFPSNSLVKESNLIDVFREDTCRTSWF